MRSQLNYAIVQQRHAEVSSGSPRPLSTNC
jgi:hypothetical protein